MFVLPCLTAVGEPGFGLCVRMCATQVFNMTGWYPDVQHALFERGWKQNPERESPFFDLKWMLKSKDVKHSALLSHQLANHFSRASNITTKVRRFLFCSMMAAGRGRADP